MASRSEFLEEALTISFWSTVWDHFGFSATYDDSGKKVVDKTTTVCKHCATHVAYANGNTSNMLAHLRRHHSSVSNDSERESREGQNNFYCPKHLSNRSVKSQTGLKL